MKWNVRLSSGLLAVGLPASSAVAPEPSPPEPGVARDTTVDALAFSTNDSCLASCSTDRTALIWDISLFPRAGIGPDGGLADEPSGSC